MVLTGKYWEMDQSTFPSSIRMQTAPARILALSHKGVVRLLELAFPHAIDKLQADEGHRDGQKPVVVDDVPLEVWAVGFWLWQLPKR